MILVWGKSEQTKNTDAARRIQYIGQRKSATGYTLEFNKLADELGWDDTIRTVTYPQGSKQHIREAVMTNGSYNTYQQMTDEAERLVSEIFSVRRFQSGKFAGKCIRAGNLAIRRDHHK